MTEIEKIRRYITNTKIANRDAYCARVGELIALCGALDSNAYEGIYLAFSYGMAKGYRAAKAEVKA